MPETNPLLSLPKVELTKVDKIANNVTANATKRSETVKAQGAARNTVINASEYDRNIEKLQSYGSKWNDYGFNPNGNSEAFYDKMTSDTEQWGRSIVGASKLAAIGFNDSFLFGAFSNSKSNADNFAKVADMYSTKRGGVTGFTQNLALNAGYTMGIMADMAIEEAAIAGVSLLAALPSGGSSVVAGGAGMIAKGVKAFGQIGKAFDKMNDLKKAINAADKINDVSKLAKFGNKVGNFINPIEHTTKYIKALKNVSSVKDLTTLGKVAEGGAALFRDVKAMQMAYSEARLEANMLEKDMSDAFRKENPYMTEEESKDMSDRIAKAKQYTTWENAGAIFATNKLVFNNMYKRFDDIKGVGKFFSTGSFGKLAAGAEGTTVIRSGNMLQKGFYQGIKDQGKLLFEKGLVNGLGKIGKTVVAKTGKYGISNLGEGLQETIQETIQAKNKYQFGSKASGGYFDSVLHGLKEQRSAQGFETFLGGFLMGGLVSPVTSIASAPLTFAKTGAYKQFTNKEAFNTEREKKLDELKKDSELINEGFKNVGHVYNSMGNSLASQARIEKEMIEAVAEGDRHIFQDKKDESFRTHLHTMMKHGMLDEFIKTTKGFKNMDSKQAALAFGIDENTKPAVIDKLIAKKVEQAERFKNRYVKFKADYQSPVNLSKLDMADPKTMEVINYHHNWNKAVDDMIFNTAEFEQNLDRKKDLLNVIQTDAEASGIAYHDYNALTSDKEMNKEIGLLNQEVSVLNGYENLTPEAKKDLTKKSHKLKALVRYQESLGEHTRVINKIEELQDKPTTTKAEKALLKKLNKQVKRAADTMELRHGQYLEVVHSGEYDPSNVTVNEASRNSRVNRFSKGSFALLYDYYKLEHRNKALEESLDILSDPEYLTNYVDRMNKMSDQVIEQHKEYVKNSIAKFRDQEDLNKVVKELLDAGVSFDLSEMDELIEKGIMPKQFFDIATQQVLKQSDPKYTMALKKLNDLVDNLIEQPILEKENDIYREVGRGVRINEKDKRTYNEIAKEYGFDVANEQKVSDVLDTIIASKSSTQGEKDLAKILKKLVDENAKVSFVDNSSRPNKFKDGVSIIDGRYAASNFTNSVFSIEELILKNELERLTTDALKNDPVFNAEVKSLKEATMAYIKSENEKNKDKPSEQIKDNWKAFDSELDFIKESFGNQTFQTLLARVKAPKKESTIWTDLIDALSNLLSRTADVSNSVYNSIVSVVQAKIDPSQLNAPEQDDSLVEEDEEAPEVTPEAVDVVEDLPVLEEESFDPNAELSAYPKALLNQLIDGYKQAIKDGDVIADAKINELSDTNLTPKFKSWVDDYGTKIITAYDAAVNEPMPNNSEILDDENKSILAGKGYTAEQINAMTPAQVEKALTENVTVDTETSLEEQVVDELIDENINIVNNEETSEEEIPTDTTGEGTGNTVGNETNQKENPKQPKSIGTNAALIVVDDVLDAPKAFNEWINHEVSSINGNQLAIHKVTDDIHKFGQELDANNSEWSIGSFRAQVDRRLIVDVFANGKRFLVYKSIGEGTGAESKGEWTPLFGFAESGWFIKTNWKGVNPKFNKYDSITFKNIDAYLKTAEDKLFSDNQSTPSETKEEVPTTASFRTDTKALEEHWDKVNSGQLGVSPMITTFITANIKLAEEQLKTEAKSNKKLFKKVVEPTKQEIEKRAKQLFIDKVQSTKQDGSEFEWIVMDGLDGYIPKFKSSNMKTEGVRDVRLQPNVFNYTFHENYDSEGRRFVAILIPVSDPTNPTRPAVYAGISILIPDSMNASDIANPILEEAKKISANRSSSNNPTTTKEMKDMAIPMAKQIIEDKLNNKTTGSTSTEDTTSKVKPIPEQITKAFEDLAKSVGEASAKKMQEYADRIKAGEAKEKVLEGLGKSFIAGVNALLGDAVLSESSIEAKRVSAQSKIKRTDLFDGVGDFSKLGGSDLAAVPISHKEINGIEFVEYAHPKTGSVDVIVTGKSDNDFVGFYRIYENGKPTNKWSSKFENQSRNKEDFKTMISGVQEMLPQGHEYTEKTSISTDGLRVWAQQLSKGYELQYDNKGSLITNSVAINGDAINNELGIEVNKGTFDNISVTNNSDMKKVKNALLPYLEKFGLNESNINFVNGTVEIDLPVLKKSSSVAQETTNEKSEKVDVEKRREEELLSIKDVSNTEDPRYVSTVGYKVGNFWTKEAAEKAVNAKYDAELKALDDTKSKSTLGKNASMHQQLVDKLTSGKSVKAKLTGKTPNSNTGFVMEVDGKKVIIYDHDVAIKAEDFGKPVTLKLIPVLKRPGKEDLKNVIQVYSGDRFLGNVALTDYDTTAKETLPKDPTEEEIRNAATIVVNNNEPIFATDESKMIALGYTQTDIKKFKAGVKMHIIKNEITKQQFVAEQKALDKLKVENQIQSNITNFLKDKFTGVKTEEALVKVYDELIKHATSKMKVTLDEINGIHLPFIQNLFNQAKIDLANQKDFSTLSVGDKLLLTDGRIVKVAKVNKTSVDVVDFNSIIENKAKLTSKQFNTDVKKVINDFNLKQDEIVSALDQNNLDDLSSILSKFTTQSFAIADEAVTDEDILEHFKACK